MIVPYTVGTSEATERVLFRCERCKHEGPVLLRGEGQASSLGWGEGASADAGSAAIQAAREDLLHNEEILRCPRCSYRRPGAARAWWIRRLRLSLAIMLALTVLAIALLASESGPVAVGVTFLGMGILSVGVAAYDSARMWRRFTVDHQADRTGDALKTFMNHVEACRDCDLNGGKKGLCERGKTLYAAKERQERG